VPDLDQYIELVGRQVLGRPLPKAQPQPPHDG
jgi:hypothetical protein